MPLRLGLPICLGARAEKQAHSRGCMHTSLLTHQHGANTDNGGGDGEREQCGAQRGLRREAGISTHGGYRGGHGRQEDEAHILDLQGNGCSLPHQLDMHG